MDNIDLAERLKKLREANGYSLRELAEHIDSSPNTVMRWEKNQSTPSQDFILKLADLYSRDPIWMMFGVKKPNANQKQTELKWNPNEIQSESKPNINRTHAES